MSSSDWGDEIERLLKEKLDSIAANSDPGPVLQAAPVTATGLEQVVQFLDQKRNTDSKKQIAEQLLLQKAIQAYKKVL